MSDKEEQEQKQEEQDSKPNKVEETVELPEPKEQPKKNKKEVVSKDELEELYKEVAGSKEDKLSPEEIARRAVEEYKRKEQKAAQEAQKEEQISKLEEQVNNLKKAIETQGTGRQSRVPSNTESVGADTRKSGDPVKIHKQQFDDAVGRFLKTQARPKNRR